MSYREKIEERRNLAGGYALYVLDAPQDAAQDLRGLGFGRAVTAAAFHREHPHSAYLFDTKEERPDARRTDTLILPTGSLKRTRQFTGKTWETVSDYCSRPHHWAKLGLHLTDLEAVFDRYPADTARQTLAEGDLLLSPLPAVPIAALCREFCPADFAAQQSAVNAAAVKKARRQLLPFTNEAIRAALSCGADLLWLDERLSTPYPEGLLDALKEDHKKTDPALAEAPCLRPVSPEDRVLMQASNLPCVPVCSEPEEIPDNAAFVLLDADWAEAAPLWAEHIQSHPETVYLFPNLPHNLRHLPGILRKKEEESGQILPH